MPNDRKPQRTSTPIAAPEGCVAPAKRVACEKFLRTHDLRIRGVVKGYAGPQVEFDDLLQEVRMVLIRDLPKFRYDPARGTVGGWVASVALHAAAREAQRLASHLMEDLTPEMAAVLMDPGAGPAAPIDLGQNQQESEAIVAELRAKLPESDYRVLALHCMDGRTMPVIAAEFGVSRDCIRMRLRRLRREAGDLLRRAGFTGLDNS